MVRRWPCPTSRQSVHQPMPPAEGAAALLRKIQTRRNVAAALRVDSLLAAGHPRGAPTWNDHTVANAALLKREERKPGSESEDR
jgi:hypothetical protein